MSAKDGHRIGRRSLLAAAGAALAGLWGWRRRSRREPGRESPDPGGEKRPPVRWIGHF